jgi:hypothetical protein
MDSFQLCPSLCQAVWGGFTSRQMSRFRVKRSPDLIMINHFKLNVSSSSRIDSKPDIISQFNDSAAKVGLIALVSFLSCQWYESSEIRNLGPTLNAGNFTNEKAYS